MVVSTLSSLTKSTNNEFLDPLFAMKNLWLSSVNRVVIENLNMNSLPDKSNQLKKLVLKYEDNLILTETILFQIRCFQLMAFAVDILSTSIRPALFLKMQIRHFDNILLTGDFYTKIYDHYLKLFLYQCGLKSLVKEKLVLKVFKTQVVLICF